MALSFSRQEQRFIPEWNGNRDLPETEQISVAFRPLTVGDMFAVQHETKVNMFGGFGLDTNDADSMERYWGLLKHVLSKYTSDYRNIEVDGVQLTKADEVAEAIAARHMPLLAEVFNHLVIVSAGTEEQAKNSASLSESSSTESVLIAANVEN